MFKVPSFALVCLALACLLSDGDAYPSKHDEVSTESLQDLRNEYEAQLLRFKETEYRLQLTQARYSLLKLKLQKEENGVNKIKVVDLCEPEPCQSGFHCVPTNDGQTDGQTYKCVKNLDENLADTEQTRPKLFKVTGTRTINIEEIAAKRGNVNSDGVFILELAYVIYQFNGKNAKHEEKLKAMEFARRMQGKQRIETLEERRTPLDHPFYRNLLSNKAQKGQEAKGTKEMFVVSDADGSLDLFPVDGYGKDKLKSEDVFIINTGEHVYCWIGIGASLAERKNAVLYASNYLNRTKTPWLPKTVVEEGNESNMYW